jgi:hypothetical protein
MKVNLHAYIDHDACDRLDVIAGERAGRIQAPFSDQSLKAFDWRSVAR